MLENLRIFGQTCGNGLGIGINHAFDELVFLGFGAFCVALAGLTVLGRLLDIGCNDFHDCIDVLAAGALAFAFDGGLDGAAALMAQHHHQRASQVFGSVLNAAEDNRIGDIAGNAHHKYFAQPLVKKDFGRDA